MLPTKYVHISEDWDRVLTKIRFKSLERKGPCYLFIQQALTKESFYLKYPEDTKLKQIGIFKEFPTM